jgi:hypothetical protein
VKAGWLAPSLYRAHLRTRLQQELDALDPELVEKVILDLLAVIAYEKKMAEKRKP